MTRKPLFWIPFALAAILAATLAVRFFSSAFPIVSLDLRMDRAGALRSAGALAARHHWGPSDFRKAASFDVDDTVKTFVELEGGGSQTFRRMISGGLYEAYTWRVRLFREGEERETLVRFTPAGRPYGFLEKLREDEPGASLPEDSARVIAERSAAEWGVDLSRYARVEASREVQPGGRADHTFVYERPGAVAGDGRYRLRLVVGGDRLTELTHFLRVPEAFARRYEKMRSTNTAIAFSAQAVTAVLYLIGGCIVGLFLLLRRRRVLWGPAFVLGVVVAGLQTVSAISSWPLTWMSYDTALPASTFLLNNVAMWALGFLADACLLILSFAAAESLGRLAFPDHPQQWRLWSRDAAGTRQVAGRTAGGLLLAAVEFGYVIGFYVLASRLWKWWIPSESLVNPDVLASWLPWLSAVAPSLHAGIWEEALFRAVPIACGALIGQRFGHRGLGIGIALVLESLVFGGAHANYASVPPYSRPVELFIPALIWGLVYLRFGLLPSIITHYLFDLVLFALPLFTSTAAGSRVDQTMVVLCGLVPVGAVIIGLARARGARELPESLRNRAWVPEEEEAAEEPAPAVTAASGLGSNRARVLLAAGAAGLLAWALVGSFHADTPPLTIRRGEAMRRGAEALRSIGYEPAARWKMIATVEGDGGMQGVFAWRALGHDLYRKLLGRDLMPPHWRVRAESFTGDVAERAEEWQADVGADGAILRLRHKLPQGRPGASLDEAAARTLAHGEVAKAFNLDATTLKEISAVSSKLPARLDWAFTFADTSSPRLPSGERRMAVEIAGDRVSDAYRFVFVPETWQRAYRGEEALLGILNVVRGLAIAFIIIMAGSLAILAWTRGRFPVGHALAFFAALAVIAFAASFNMWPTYEAAFSTAQPFRLQATLVAVGVILTQLILAALVALMAGGARGELSDASRDLPAPNPLYGIALGACAAGVLILVGIPGIASGPRWGNYSAAQGLVPLVGEALSPVKSLLLRGSVMLAALILLHQLTRAWTARRWLGLALGVVVGGLAVHPANAHQPGLWIAQALAAGVALTALYVFFLRFDLRLVPWMIATLGVLNAGKAAVMRAHPDALAGAIMGGVLVVAAVVWWTAELGRPAPAPAAGAADTGAPTAAPPPVTG